MNGSVTYEGLILQGGINVDTTADLEELTAYENGVYNPSEGKDGFSKVTVDVPAAVLDDITITENGTYTPPIGVDGYNDIVVSVPHPAPVLDDITITENGSYTPPTGVDGYDDITVNVLPTLDDITITENGTYIPPTGTDGYNEITVNVPLPANGIYKQTLSNLPQPIATFTGADAPIDELIVSIDAVQDLHGYDHPWPAGGGVNRLDPDSIIQGSTLIPSATNRCSNRGTKTILVSVGDTFTVSRQSTNVRYTMAIRDVVTDEAYSDTGWETSNYFTFTVDQAGYMEIIFSYPDNANITPNEVKAAHFQIEKNSSATPFTPYSNICPISGWSGATITNTDDLTDPTVTRTVTISFGQDVYGGYLNVSTGELTVTDAYIASYNGETLPSTWISDRDVYASGTTPTTGAEVVYKLATPTTIQLTPTQVRTLLGNNNISVNCGEVTECKYYSDTP